MAFVGITNHVLDAAKTNRAVSLFRPIASQVCEENTVCCTVVCCVIYRKTWKNWLKAAFVLTLMKHCRNLIQKLLRNSVLCIIK